MVPWAHQSLQPKWEIYRFSRFAGLTSVTDQLTDRHSDRQTDHTTQSVTIYRIYVCSIAMRPNNNDDQSRRCGS